MRSVADKALAWIEAGIGCAFIEISEAQGSTPREQGAFMAVTPDACAGTIGGGQMEFHAIERARALLAEGRDCETLALALGPHLGQCCGGSVVMSIRRASRANALQYASREKDASRPDIFILGAGHTGLALARALAPLPFRVRLIDDRDEARPDVPDGVSFLQLADPAEAIAAAPSGAGFVILTHSHALDYRLAEAALRRGAAAYVGMIGSATKRARFVRWFRAQGGTEAQLQVFVCPLGGKAVHDKRPEVIAALTAAELIHRFLVVEATKNAGIPARPRASGGKAA